MIKIRRIALVALLMLISAGAFASGNRVSETVLPNGLKVLIKEVHAAPVFVCQVWYKVGSRNEYAGVTGLSHLVEHSLFNSTKNYGKGETARITKAKGGQNNGGTYFDWTNYWELMSSNNLEFVLKIESDRMVNAKFDPKEFAAEKVVVRSELEGDENEVDRLFYNSMMSNAYMVHSYRNPIIGYRSDVENVSRDTAYKWYRSHYMPNNATVVIVGDVDTAKTLALVRKYFGSIPKGPEPPKVYTTEPEQHGERRFVLHREGTTERVMIGYHIPGLGSPDGYPLMMLDQILSGGRSARLYQALVEGQIATSAWSNSGSRKDPDLFMVGATGKEGSKSANLEKALLEQVEKIKAAPPTEEELTRAKNQMQAYLIYNNDSVSDQGEQLGYYETIASWKYLDTLLPKLMAVTVNDVQRVAKQYLTEDNRTVGWFVPTGPAKGGEESPSALGGETHLKDIRSNPVALYNPAATAGRGPGKTVKMSKVMKKAPAPADHPAKTVKPTRVVLKNGIVVIIQENHSNATVAVKGSVKAGGICETPDKKKIASFVADMLSRGTTKRSALDIATLADASAADVSVDSDIEAARFTAKGLSKDFNLLLDLLSDELRNPSFPQEQIARLKAQTVAQLEMEKEDPQSVAYRQFSRMVYPEGHPYRPQTLEEDQASVKALSRDDLVDFHKKFYGPETTIIAISGDVKPNEAVAAIEKYFGDWKPTGTVHTMNIPKLALASKPSLAVVPMPDKAQVNVICGHAGQLKRTDPDYYAATVMNEVLGGGGGLDSKLGLRIREHMGLVYSVWSSFDAGMGDGPWVAGFGANPANVDKALAAMDDVLRSYIKTGPTKKEFKDAVDYLIGVFPIRLETNDGVAGILAAEEFYGLGMDYIQKHTAIYEAVTMDQVREATKKYLHPDKQAVVIVGDYKGSAQTKQ